LSLLFPFVHSFYAQQLPLFFSHHSLERKLFVILLFMGMCQGDMFVRPLFALAHFLALQASTIAFLSYLFPSLTYDTHILDPASFVPFVFDHFAS
jgi:hypothetical protein